MKLKYDFEASVDFCPQPVCTVEDFGSEILSFIKRECWGLGALNSGDINPVKSAVGIYALEFFTKIPEEYRKVDVSKVDVLQEFIEWMESFTCVDPSQQGLVMGLLQVCFQFRKMADARFVDVVMNDVTDYPHHVPAVVGKPVLHLFPEDDDLFEVSEGATISKFVSELENFVAELLPKKCMVLLYSFTVFPDIEKRARLEWEGDINNMPVEFVISFFVAYFSQFSEEVRKEFMFFLEQFCWENRIDCEACMPGTEAF